eukprot:COSAG05_NODE_1678_length_4291_cov_649.414122_1_plen_53_part_00
MLILLWCVRFAVRSLGQQLASIEVGIPTYCTMQRTLNTFFLFCFLGIRKTLF